MTVKEFYSFCLNLLGFTEQNNPLTKDYFAAVLNSILADCFLNENADRRLRGMPELLEPQLVGGFDDEIVYTDTITRTLLAFGVCAKLAMADEDIMQAGHYDNLYEAGKVRVRRAAFCDVDNFYGE